MTDRFAQLYKELDIDTDEKRRRFWEFYIPNGYSPIPEHVEPPKIFTDNNTSMPIEDVPNA